jgi:energy-converting hydrogenase A subunit R
VSTVRRVFVSDCEGPISKNDNAFELTSRFVPDGDKLFTVVSRYDDVLAEVVRKTGYHAGGTLKLVLPFLKAYGVTDQKMREFSAEHLVCVPGIKDTLKHVRGLAPAFIVSASYEHYLRALCEVLEFPFENTYCTRVCMDKYGIRETEKEELKQTVKEIAQIPVFEIPSDAESLDDLPKEHQKTVKRLDEIFWKRIAEMEIGRIYCEVNPVGGGEKAEAIKDIVHELGIAVTDVMYVGDSITDDEAFKLVERKGGLTVSFNGNQYAIRNAEVAVLSENSIVTAVVADAFLRFGKPEAICLVKNWNRRALEKSPVSRNLLDRLFSLYPGRLPKARIITNQNMETLAEESSRFRNKVRGEAIGRLG